MNCTALKKAIDKYLIKAEKGLADDLEAAGFAEGEDTVKRINALEDKTVQAMEAETEIILAALRRSGSLEDFALKQWPKIKEENELGKDLSACLEAALASALGAFAASYLQELDKELQYRETEKGLGWAKSWSKTTGAIVQRNGLSDFERLLQAAMKKGEGVEVFTQTLMERWMRNARYKARRLAITEMLRTHSYANEEAINQCSSVESRQWMHTGQHRNEPRPGHVALNGAVVPKHQPFTLQGADGATYYPMFPRDDILPPGEVVSCHCIHRGIVSKAALGLPLPERQKLQAEAVLQINKDWEDNLHERNRRMADLYREAKSKAKAAKTDV